MKDDELKILAELASDFKWSFGHSNPEPCVLEHISLSIDKHTDAVNSVADALHAIADAIAAGGAA